MSSLDRLSRAAWRRAVGADRARVAPIRILHLGLGAFHRAHQAWWTDAVRGDDPWGIAAFTGRSRRTADLLTEQDGLFTLIERGPQGDAAQVVGSISRALDGADTACLTAHLADAAVVVATLTVSEAGYRLDGQGGLDLADPAVAADRRQLTLWSTSRHMPAFPVHTVPGRILAGLLGRRAADAGPIAIVCCDNLLDNGRVLRSVLQQFAEAVDSSLCGWLDSSVSFVSTTVDRITPAAAREHVATSSVLTGWDDRAPVVTEPYREWVLAGSFPAGRPPWHEAGALFVDDVAPFAHRKLWLLNGAHSLLAYAGLLSGHTTIAEAIDDPCCHVWVERWWDEAAPHVGLHDGQIRDYRAQLLWRFGNPRLDHLLEQVAADGSSKLAIRVVPVLRREVAAGHRAQASLRPIAAWIGYLRSAPAVLRDPLAPRLAAAARRRLPDACRTLLAVLDTELADHAAVVADLIEAVGELTSATAHG